MVASKQCVIFTDFNNRSLFQSEYIADAVRAVDISPSNMSIYWFDLNSSFNLLHSETSWHELPRFDEGTPRANPKVRSNTSHPRQKAKPTSTHGDDIDMPEIDWDIAEVLISVGQASKVGAICYRIHGYFSSIGKAPGKIQIIVPMANGYRTDIWSWDDVIEAAGHERLSRRFRSIYSFNFRAIAGNAIKSSVANQPTSAEGMPPFDERLKAASMGGFRLEFLQVLYRLADTPSIPYESPSSNADFVHVISAFMGEGDKWKASFTEAFRHYHPPRSGEAPQFIYWIGSGRYPALSGNYSDFVYSGTFHAVCHALKLGFVRTTPETGVIITPSGRDFIGRLSNKLEDADAPIRWGRIDEENLSQSDIWLKKHLQLLKRSISQHT